MNVALLYNLYSKECHLVLTSFLASVFGLYLTVLGHCLQSNNGNVTHQHPGESEQSLPSVGGGSHTVSVCYCCMSLPLSSVQYVVAG